MKKLVTRDVYASEVSEYLGVKWKYEDFIVTSPSSLQNIKEGSLIYVNKSEELPNIKNVLIITDIKTDRENVISVLNPLTDFYKVIDEFFMDEDNSFIDDTAVIGSNCSIGSAVSIGRNCILNGEVRIGNGATIGHNVIIYGNVEIGKNCIIKDNAIIGAQGFNYIFDGEKKIIIPSLGKIIIEENVHIGSNSSIELPKFDETRIKSYVKIDDLVNIGSNCVVNENACIIAGSILCHGVSIGKNSLVGAGVIIRDTVSIGDNCTIGMGSVVITDIKNNIKVAGNPARII